MQIRASKNNRLVLASFASKGENYHCPECQNVVRLRGGPHRQPHFFHLKAHRECRQHQKGPIHIALQLYVQSLMPNGQMERAFPEIGRIADFACDETRRIFEIQVSPISGEEVEARCRDYESLGYEVVWILHDNRYNKRRLSPAEIALHGKCRYFSNMNANAKGIIYDQFEEIAGFRRIKRGPPVRIDLRTYRGQIKPVFRISTSSTTFYRRVFQLLLQKIG